MEFDKDEMTDILWKAKLMVVAVWEKTQVDEVGNVMCSIDEAIGAIEDL